jgi:thiamine-monophosphate kinase
VSEFDLIKRYFKSSAQQRDDVILGIGDDCALLSPPAGKLLAHSTDTLIAGVHFPQQTTAFDIGYKSLAVNLSDLAAMGAEPAWVSLAISLPSASETWLEQFMLGFNQLSGQYRLALIGGDTTRGPLSITVGVTGFVDEARSFKRSNASAGDAVFVSGTIADARLGLQLLQQENKNEDCTQLDRQFLLDRLNRPTPRLDVASLLGSYPLAAIDLSDGLLSDLQHICDASSSGARIDLDKIPLSAAAHNQLHNRIDWSLVLNAGDDYELCFTCKPENIKAMQKAMHSRHIQVTQIGEITDTPGIVCELDGQPFSLANANGYDHFSHEE